MKLFRKKKEETTNAPPTVEQDISRAAGVLDSRAANVLCSPRITEKATDLGGRSAYVFDVAPYSNKRSIMAAVRHTYNVTPRMVRIVQIPRKIRKNVRTGKSGVTRGGKKAYVYLKAGESITMS